MCRRFFTLSLVMLAAPLVWGAEPAPPTALPSEQAPATGVDLASELKTIKDDLRSLSSNLTQVVERVSEQQAQIGQLRSELITLTDQIQEEIRKQQQILEMIAQTDAEGKHVPRLSAAMESSHFRQEMQQVVNQSLRTTGTLRITNLTNDLHRVFVNRTEYTIPAGQILTLPVPAGTVSTQLPGRELKNWTIAGPNYEQNVEIVPDSTPVTTYVARPTVPAASVYYSPFPTTSSLLYYWPY